MPVGNAVARHRLLDRRRCDAFFIRQCFERRDHDRFPVDFEKPAQRFARVAAAVAVGPECHVAARHPGADEVGKRADVVARRDDRSGRVRKARLDIARALRRRRMQRIPALDCEPVAAQLGEARHAPDVRGDAEFLFEHLGRGQCFTQDRSGTEELNWRLPFLASRLPQRDTSRAGSRRARRRASRRARSSRSSP